MKSICLTMVALSVAAVTALSTQHTAAAPSTATSATMSVTPAPPPTTPSIAPPNTKPYDGVYYKRQLYVVTDMERALTLWRDVMGMQAGAITVSGPTSYSREVFNLPANASVRFCSLSAGPQQIRTLSLLEVKGVPLEPKRGIRTTGAVINANGRLDDIVTRAKALGLTVLERRVLNSTDQGVGIEQALLDWDGNVIVLYQFPHTTAPSQR